MKHDTTTLTEFDKNGKRQFTVSLDARDSEGITRVELRGCPMADGTVLYCLSSSMPADGSVTLTYRSYQKALCGFRNHVRDLVK